MQSSKFQKIAKRIARRDRAVFDTLMKFEKTRKVRSKKRLNFTVDKAVASRFRKFCRDHGYNMSAKIEQAMRSVIEKR